MNNIKSGSNIAMIGFGYCGCSMVDQAIEIIKQQDNLLNNYEPYLVDCSHNFHSDNINKYDSMNFLDLTSGGTAKIRKLAKIFMNNNVNMRSFIYRNFRTGIYDSVYLIASSNGGTGSACIIEFAKRIRAVNNTISINLIVLIPELHRTDLYDLKNTLQLNNEIKAELEQSIDYRKEKIESKSSIDSVVYVTNKGSSGKSDFDKELMDLMIKSIEIETNYRINRFKDRGSTGYKIILPIKNKNMSSSEAIQEAIEKSNVILPDEFFDKAHEIYLLPNEEVYFNKILAIFNDNIKDASINDVLKVVIPKQDLKFSISEKEENIIIAEGYYNKNNKVLPTKVFEFFKEELVAKHNCEDENRDEFQDHMFLSKYE